MKKLLLWIGLMTIPCLIAEQHPKINFGLFVDTYYAFDSCQPDNLSRAYTTLPTRHNEFAVNLAYVEAKLEDERIRGRLSLQTGTSVFANYSSEYRDPTKTGTQLADILMFIQEAYAGIRISEPLWLDAGIYFSHIGMEGFISRDNWTYTRSLIADFSPYYQAGVRLTYNPTPRWTFQLHLLNGWQNMIDNNSDKAIGTQVSVRPIPRLSITHNSFVGREAELRIFQDFIVKYEFSPVWESGVAFDYGLQRRASGNFGSWYGASLQNRIKISELTHLGLRVEYYSDPEGIIVPTSTANNFQVLGASVNLDHRPVPPLLWRTEVRVLHSRDSIFPAKGGNSADSLFAITSLALTL